MARQKILYISQEISPYVPDTPLANLGRMLPQKMQENGYEVRTFMPKYGCINERRNQLHEVIRLSGMNIPIDDTDHPLVIKVATLQPTRMQVYFIDNEDFFHHTPSKELELVASPEDNDERMMFYVRGVVETVKKLRWEPALIHVTGWITALAPLYIKKLYAEDPTIAQSKVVFTLRPEAFEGTLDERLADKLKMSDFSDEDIATLGNGPVDNIALNKLAISYADAVVVSSPEIPQELVDYAKSLSIPILMRSGDDEDYENVAQFYAGLIG